MTHDKMREAFERCTGRGHAPDCDPERELFEMGWHARVPHGYVVVPREPTGEMLDAAWTDARMGGYSDFKEIYTAMIAAAEKGE